MRIAYLLLADATAAELATVMRVAAADCALHEVLLLAPDALLAGDAVPDPRLRRVRLRGVSVRAHRVERELAMFGPDRVQAGSARAARLLDRLYPRRDDRHAGEPARCWRFPRRPPHGLRYLLRAARYLWTSRVLRPPTLVAEARYCAMRFEARTADRHARKLSRHGVHEPVLTAWLLENLRLRAGEVALDVGANIGWYSVLLDRLAEPGVSIFCFEPDPENGELLRRNLERNAARRVQVVAAAVSDTGHGATLHRAGGGNRGRHTLLPLHAGDDIAVPTLTLDAFWDEAGLGERALRLLKIDIEGHEAAALRGASRVLARCAMLLMEYSPRFLRAAALDVEEPLRLPLAAGLRPHVFNGDGLRAVDVGELLATEGQVNLLWLR